MDSTLLKIHNENTDKIVLAFTIFIFSVHHIFWLCIYLKIINELNMHLKRINIHIYSFKRKYDAYLKENMCLYEPKILKNEHDKTYGLLKVIYLLILNLFFSYASIILVIIDTPNNSKIIWVLLLPFIDIPCIYMKYLHIFCFFMNISLYYIINFMFKRNNSIVHAIKRLSVWEFIYVSLFFSENNSRNCVLYGIFHIFFLEIVPMQIKLDKLCVYFEKFNIEHLGSDTLNAIYKYGMGEKIFIENHSSIKYKIMMELMSKRFVFIKHMIPHEFNYSEKTSFDIMRKVIWNVEIKKFEKTKIFLKTLTLFYIYSLVSFLKFIIKYINPACQEKNVYAYLVFFSCYFYIFFPLKFFNLMLLGKIEKNTDLCAMNSSEDKNKFISILITNTNPDDIFTKSNIYNMCFHGCRSLVERLKYLEYSTVVFYNF